MRGIYVRDTNAPESAEPELIRARRGVILGIGGFEHNEQMRVKYQRAPITTEWTVGAKANTGDGILAGEKLGAALDIMEDAWWGPTVPLVGAPWFALAERNSARLDHRQHVGQAVHERVDAVRRGVPPHVRRRVRPGPGSRREHPGLAGLRPAVPRPLHLRGTAAGTAHSEEVAGVRRHRQGRHARGAGRPRSACPPTRSQQTVERFNGFARSGIDEDFHRGESAYDRYYGDPTNKPNPNLGEISHGAVLRGQDGARRPRHQGRHRHRRARAACCATTARSSRACTPPAMSARR